MLEAYSKGAEVESGQKRQNGASQDEMLVCVSSLRKIGSRQRGEPLERYCWEIRIIGMQGSGWEWKVW